MKSSLLLLAATAVSGSVLPRSQAPCPFHTPEADAVPSQYMVRLKEGHTLDAHFAKIGKDLRKTGELIREMSIINGYRATLDDATVHDRIRHDPMVEYVEQDHYLTTPYAPSEDPPKDYHEDLKARGKLERRQTEYFVTDELSEWWHSYITVGHTVNSLNKNFQPRANNFEGAGAGVDIYIMDSGVRLSHSWFQGRASNFGNGPNSSYTGGSADDQDSHGTHVASIAAKVAPNANIINVKVTCKRVNDPKNAEPNCKGTASGAIDALEDIAKAHGAKQQFPQGFRGSVINMSFGQQNSQSLKDAITDAVNKKGIPVAVAAGNTNTDKVLAPCSYNKNVICVGAVGRSYKKAEFSNYGSRLSIQAPGDGIRAASINGDNEVTWKTGTSQASPMVAGTMALYVGWEGFSNNVNAIYDRLRNNALPDVATGFDDKTTKLFLNTGINNPKKDAMVPYLGATVGFSFGDGGVGGIGKSKVAEGAALDNVKAADGAQSKAADEPQPKATDSAQPKATDSPAPGGTTQGPADPTPGGTTQDDQPAAPTGDPSASGSGPLPTSDIRVPKGYASIGEADGANSSMPATITLSWTAPISGPTTDPGTETSSGFEDVVTLSDDVSTTPTAGPATTTSSSTPSSIAPSTTSSSIAPSKTPDMNSNECKNCQNTLGASDCKADDLTCLHDQCKNDKDCQTCGLDCNTVGGTK